ncbi:hypothetical protein DHW03_03260 [Pedobacter yonginense]|uniref:Prepilin-type cleavage/methylation domain-containing protein n=1 Tax=Pedobacter yonginense TaxID=651869 RepID=A0A317EUC6_9SPHI|nr:hypothetical protein [Pedobacter yonginense]PWS28866.1 hypothetical protein DHW03_03260 [Pedobacter yonginense]
MKKINAFTLLEVTFAMLLSAICVGICYTAYGLIGDYYQHFREKNEQTDEVLALRQVLEKDFLGSRAIVRSEKGINLLSDSSAVQYGFEAGFVTRAIGQLHTDTFKLRTEALNAFFEGRETQQTDTLDQIRFTIRLKNSLTVPIDINKTYSATDLYR